MDKKKYIKEVLLECYSINKVLNKGFSNFIVAMIKLRRKYKNDYGDLRIELFGGGVYNDLVIYGTREETDEEYEERIADDRREEVRRIKIQEMDKEKELKLYNKLKAKYGN